MAETRSTIFLYTDAAQIDARTKKAMVAAGFLPVKVATLDAVKFLEPQVPVPAAEVSEILRAALDALMNGGGSQGYLSSAQQYFTRSLARRLVAAHDAVAPGVG